MGGGEWEAPHRGVLDCNRQRCADRIRGEAGSDAVDLHAPAPRLTVKVANAAARLWLVRRSFRTPNEPGRQKNETELVRPRAACPTCRLPDGVGRAAREGVDGRSVRRAQGGATRPRRRQARSRDPRGRGRGSLRPDSSAVVRSAATPAIHPPKERETATHADDDPHRSLSLARSVASRSIAANAGQTGVSAGSLSAGSASGLTPDTVCAALGGVLPDGAELRSVTDATQSCANSLPVPLPPRSLAALLAPCGRI